MPALNEEGPVKVAVNIHKDGKAVTAQAAPVKAVGQGSNMFSALANTRRIVPEAPPPPTQLFNPPMPRAPPSDDESSYLGEDDGFSDEDGDSADSRGFRGLEENAERTKAMKSECLQKLHRYAQQGFPVPEHLGMRSSLEDLQDECDRIKRGIDTQNSIQFQRRMLVTFVTGVEYVNGAYDPLAMVGGPSVQLQGWSKNVMSEIDSFDAVFEQLYEKYRNRAPMPPELQLFMALAMSAVVCHMQNSNGSVARPPQGQSSYAPQTQTRPPPAPAPAAPKQPQNPPPQSARKQPEESLSRSNPDPAPYIMQAPPAMPPSMPGLGIFPSLQNLSMGAAGPALVSIDVPAGSAEEMLNPPPLQVPPRDEEVGIITEIPPSPAPSAKGRKKAPPKKKKGDAPSEIGVEL